MSEFDQISWAPEIRPVLRTDGITRRWAAARWPGWTWSGITCGSGRWPSGNRGRYFVLLTNFLMDQAGFDLTLPVAAGELQGMEYHPARLAPDLRCRLLGRLMKRACNWGWRPDEARQKRPVAALYIICQELAGWEISGPVAPGG